MTAQTQQNGSEDLITYVIALAFLLCSLMEGLAQVEALAISLGNLHRMLSELEF